MVELGRIGGDGSDDGRDDGAQGAPEGGLFTTTANRPVRPRSAPAPQPGAVERGSCGAPDAVAHTPIERPAEALPVVVYADSPPVVLPDPAPVPVTPPPPPDWFVPHGAPGPIPPPPVPQTTTRHEPAAPPGGLLPAQSRPVAGGLPPSSPGPTPPTFPAPRRVGRRNEVDPPAERVAVVDTSGAQWVVPVLVTVLVLCAVAVGAIVLLDGRQVNEFSTTAGPGGDTRSVMPSTSTTSTSSPSRPSAPTPPALPVESTIPVTTPPTVPATTTPTTPTPTSPPASLRPVPVVPLATTPPTTAAPPLPAVPFTSPDGLLSATMPGAAEASPPNGGITEFIFKMPNGASMIIGRDPAPVDPSVDVDAELRTSGRQVAASLGSTASFGTPGDLYGGRALDYTVNFRGGRVQSRVAVVADHLVWITLVQPSAVIGSGEVATAYQRALDTFQAR